MHAWFNVQKWWHNFDSELHFDESVPNNNNYDAYCDISDDQTICINAWKEATRGDL